MRKMKYWVLGLAMSVSLLVGACGQAPATGTSAAVKETTEAVTESVTVEAVQTPKAAAAQTGNSGAFDLDALGRCSVAYASVGTDTMPTEKRGNIGQVKPTGWHTVKYDFVDGKYLYNRCHLIGYQLTAENANEKNLITGTRYLNVQGMLPFENMTADYVKETENHVLYRVTPVFEGNNLVAAGVLMEAESVEDKGEGVEFCVFVYNAQPGVTIDYATGDSWLDENGTGNQQAAAKETKTVVETEIQAEKQTQAENTQAPAKETSTYILNTNSKKFHKPGCSAASQIKAANKDEFTGTRDEVIAKGYEPCKKCNP